MCNCARGLQIRHTCTRGVKLTPALMGGVRLFGKLLKLETITFVTESCFVGQKATVYLPRSK